MTYRSFNKLNGKTLKPHDTVTFLSTTYRVIDFSKSDFGLCWLTNDHGYNDTIFQELGLDANSLAKDCYGFPLVYGGVWPSVPEGDYEALTRLCLVLFGFIEGSPYVDVYMPYSGVRRIKRTDYKL